MTTKAHEEVLEPVHPRSGGPPSFLKPWLLTAVRGSLERDQQFSRDAGADISALWLSRGTQWVDRCQNWSKIESVLIALSIGAYQCLSHRREGQVW